MDNHFDSLFDKYYEEHHFAGAVLIKGSETIHFERAYGFAHRGFKVLNTTSTMFDTASVTKLFTAAAILQLVNRGKLRLDDRSGKLIRMYKEGSNAGVAVMFAYYPEIDTTSVILANQTCNVWKLHWEAEQLIFAAK